MASSVSFSDLANLAVGSPETGALNCNALHALLHGIIRHLNIQDAKALGDETMRLKDEGLAIKGGHIFPTSPILDRWEVVKIKKMAEANRDGLSTAMELIQNMVNMLKSVQTKQLDIESHLNNLSDEFERKKVEEEHQLSVLKADILDMSVKLKKMRKKQERDQAATEQRVADNTLRLQDQLKMLCELEQNKDGETLKQIQKKIEQLEKECAKLKNTTNSLIHNHEKSVVENDMFFEALKNLEEKKADKDVVEEQLHTKADKCSLEQTVSRTQFDSAYKNLSNAIKGLLGKVTLQEQEWQISLGKIKTEMQKKVEHSELDLLKDNIEESSMALSQKLKERPPPAKPDVAAGIRRQLIPIAKCLSCSHPVELKVPKPPQASVPHFPAFSKAQPLAPITAQGVQTVHHKGKHVTNFS
ncbi:unnamed protein product [Protopolystoma xenopodis]|uniref:DUF4795 domain-containing protein n=1 Tax=Protopolystoma xenopodis TaxID=117903 RepID=A0A3S5FD86_9PLAT|nr:unnamed protein product [Protopolystoma xenopodis]